MMVLPQTAFFEFFNTYSINFIFENPILLLLKLIYTIPERKNKLQ